ncbi:DUF29 domain-containing protein [Myxosarcina sp. GI1]|uniref:DUF29 domain-containing protein n=1 Tax=Myxosarcina sp. GI1 TaxID=1541065 RepID=UPI000569A37A|nr:DUF29 domain-containing protein [Myxosarcina sp. GI1]
MKIKIERDEWLEMQIAALRSRSFNTLDVENLIEELEELVRGDKAAVESFTYQIILHLLLIDYWIEESEWNRRHWRSEIVNFQFQLSNKLTTNLTKALGDRLDYIYSRALKGAIKKTELRDRFPKSRPYSLATIIGED